MENYYISDLHLGHKNALKFDKRPFLNLEEQDEVVINNINRVVKSEDSLYLLGDVFWYSSGAALHILNRLNCRHVYLVRGNHDWWVQDPECEKRLTDIYDLKRIQDQDRIVILCHYPLAAWDQSHRDSYHLYGHVHLNGNSDGTLTHSILSHPELKNAYNVGCMLPWMDYTPRTLDQIIYTREFKIIEAFK